MRAGVVLPFFDEPEVVDAAVPAEVVASARGQRAELGLPWEGYDVVTEGMTAPGASVRDWREAGATWWIESDWDITAEAVRERITAGPPS